MDLLVTGLMSQIVSVSPTVLGFIIAAQMRLMPRWRQRWWIILVLGCLASAVAQIWTGGLRGDWSGVSWIGMLQSVLVNTLISVVFSGPWLLLITSTNPIGPFSDFGGTVLFGTLLALSQGTINGWSGFELGSHVALVVAAFLAVRWFVRSLVRQVLRTVVALAGIAIVGAAILFFAVGYLPAF